MSGEEFLDLYPSWLYAAEFKDGVVKVGISRQPKTRRYSLQRERGVQIVRFHLSRSPARGFATERYLVHRLSGIGSLYMRSKRPREWFVGLKFGEAKTLVNQIAPREIDHAWWPWRESETSLNALKKGRA